MSHPIQIQDVSNYSGFWTTLFVSICFLGIYISLILLVRDRFQGRRRTVLGLYSASLSIFLMYLAYQLNSPKPLHDFLQSFGLSQLFLIGPFSFFLFMTGLKNKSSIRFLYHLIPAGLAFLCLALCSLDKSIGYVLGMVHTGLYLFVQLFWSGRKGIQGNRLAGMQMIIYLGISILCLTSPKMIHCFIASVGLSILILQIWIRLLYASYLSYFISRS